MTVANEPWAAGESIILVHGGAGRYADALHPEAVENVRAAVQRAREALTVGGDAVSAAVAAVRHLEHTPCYNAGTGACMNAEGNFETDAGIMSSKDMAVGAVGGAPDLADAILVARAVMQHSAHSVLVGPAVRRFAQNLPPERGGPVGTFDRERLFTPKAQRSYDRVASGKMAAEGRADTVGCVVLDPKGDFCAAGSTGGVLFKTPGRVGDTAMVGAGFYAHPKLGACVATGVGEAIMREVFCYALLAQHAQAGGDLQARAQAACEALRSETKAAVGVLAVTPSGAWAHAHACPHMSHAIGVGLGATARPIRAALSVPAAPG